jgi:phosphoribosylaminoimidazolecarboxamide formyltransferase/IMP cyclohydrolase
MAKTFLEVLVAPSFTPAALAVFASKKNLRIMQAPVFAFEEPGPDAPSAELFSQEAITVAGGLLVQTRDDTLFEKWETVTKTPVSDRDIDDMKFGMLVSMFAKSNAVLVIKDKAVLGAGAGQTNRVRAAAQALECAKSITDAKGEPPAHILVSDAFFPFRDCVDTAQTYGIKTIIQPGGSIRDGESVQACDEYGISMVFTGTRHFKH